MSLATHVALAKGSCCQSFCYPVAHIVRLCFLLPLLLRPQDFAEVAEPALRELEDALVAAAADSSSSSSPLGPPGDDAAAAVLGSPLRLPVSLPALVSLRAPLWQGSPTSAAAAAFEEEARSSLAPPRFLGGSANVVAASGSASATLEHPLGPPTGDAAAAQAAIADTLRTVRSHMLAAEARVDHAALALALLEKAQVVL